MPNSISLGQSRTRRIPPFSNNWRAVSGFISEKTKSWLTSCRIDGQISTDDRDATISWNMNFIKIGFVILENFMSKIETKEISGKKSKPNAKRKTMMNWEKSFTWKYKVTSVWEADRWPVIYHLYELIASHTMKATTDQQSSFHNTTYKISRKLIFLSLSVILESHQYVAWCNRLWICLRHERVLRFAMDHRKQIVEFVEELRHFLVSIRIFPILDSHVSPNVKKTIH